ncbi:MAG: phosphotransferase family protein [Aggregatilineales bacterium]
MAWPNPNQYAEAIQNPKLSFADPELQRGTVLLNKYKLPRPISGNFATVFEIEGGGRKWAVRCFLREVTNQQQRYAAITKHLYSHPLGCMVGFEYLPQGIKVGVKWYPILKMDWIPGEPLDRYIEDHLNMPATLESLADQWVNLCKSLRQADLAHGDLQHGNILVTDQNQLKLIDYDGVYIPAVIGFPQNEIGHRHYQHPSRTSDEGVSASNFRNVDNFPAQVIGLSLYALSIDSTLWEKTGAGVENLLFRDVDYNDPTGSKTLNLLRNHADTRIRTIAQRIDEAIAARNFLDVSPFERLAPRRGSGIERWLVDHLPKSNLQPLPAATNGNTTAASVPSWVLDHFEAQTALQLDFPDDFILTERQAIEHEFQNSLLRWFRPLFRPFASARIHGRFATYPLAIDKVKLETRLRLLEGEQARLQNWIAAIPQSMDDARLSAYSEVRAVEQLVKTLNDEIATSWRLEHDELARLDQYISESLAEYTITANAISGIGKARIAALNSVGIVTAADITTVNQSRAFAALDNIRGASPLLEWQKLEEWRDVQRMRVPTPSATVASSGNAEAIAARYTTARRIMQRVLQDRKHEVNRTRNAVLRSEQVRLRGLLGELAGVERQVHDAQTALQRYTKITPGNLLDKITSVPT